MAHSQIDHWNRDCRACPELWHQDHGNRFRTLSAATSVSLVLSPLPMISWMIARVHCHAWLSRWQHTCVHIMQMVLIRCVPFCPRPRCWVIHCNLGPIIPCTKRWSWQDEIELHPHMETSHHWLCLSRVGVEFLGWADSQSHHRGYLYNEWDLYETEWEECTYQLNADGISSAQWIVGRECGMQIEVEDWGEVMGYVGSHSSWEVQAQIVGWRWE